MSKSTLLTRLAIGLTALVLTLFLLGYFDRKPDDSGIDPRVEKEGSLVSRSPSQRSTDEGGIPPSQRRDLSKGPDKIEIDPAVILGEKHRLLSWDLKLLPDDWELLGIDRPTAEKIFEDLKPGIEQMRSLERETYITVSFDEDLSVINIPPLNEENSEEMRESIQRSFEKTFTSDTAEALTESLIKNGPEAWGGLSGYDRRFKVSSPKLDFSGKVRSVITLDVGEILNTTSPNGAFNQAFGATLWVEELPEQWVHLFEEE